MADHFVDRFMSSKVSNQNVFISGPAGNDVEIVPGQRSYTGSVSFISVQKTLFNTVPQLHLSRMSSDSQSVASGVEIGAGNHIFVSDIDQSYDFGVSCIPQVNRIAQAHSQQISHRPINQIKIIIVVKSGSIQNFSWDFVDSSLFFGLLDFSLFGNLNQRVGKQSVQLFL